MTEPGNDNERANRFAERYAAGEVPWDHPEPPPEVMDFAAEHPPGRALDLGCGYGRAAIYLAERGWTVDAVDFIAAAVAEGAVRARQAGVADSIRYHVGAVTDLAALSLQGPYDLAVDVGCCHRMSEEGLIAYRDGFAPLLTPGGWFLLFANLFDPDAGEDQDGQGWIKEDRLLRVLGERFTLERVEHGVTEVPDRPVRKSAWFWFRLSRIMAGLASDVASSTRPDSI